MTTNTAFSRGLATLLLAVLTLCAAQSASSAERPALDIWSAPYPRTLLFRGVERIDAGDRYEDWAHTLESYDGIVGKAQDELLKRASLLDRYVRYKKEHPRQLFLIHYLFRTRIESDVGTTFFPGHWLHFGATRLREALDADEGDATLVVRELDRIVGGAGVTVDICPAGADGRPDWKNAETVTVQSVDKARSSVRVLRAQGRTQLRAFAANSFVAARVQQPVIPSAESEDDTELGRATGWDEGRLVKVRNERLSEEEREQLRQQRQEERKELRQEERRERKAQDDSVPPSADRGSRDDGAAWWYNFATDSPRDAAGRNAGEAHARDLGGKFAPGGALEVFDGIAFDVYGRVLRPQDLKGGIDIDGDGKADSPEFCNERYGDGVYRFGQELRRTMGPDRILIAEGWALGHQLNVGVFNGMESEGWPGGHADTEMRDWSGGLSRHQYWNANSPKERALSYFVYKYRDKRRHVQVGNNIRRLFMAAAQFVDAPTTTVDVPLAAKGGGFGSKFGVMDEERGGQDGQRGWLGRPLGPPQRLARNSPDLLAGQQRSLSAKLFAATRAGSAQLSMDGAELRASAKSGPVTFQLADVPVTQGNLTVFASMRVASIPGLASGATRMLQVRFREPGSGRVIQETFHPLGRELFEGVYSVTGLAASRVTVEFEVEGPADVWVSRISAHGAPDAIVREFEHGLVMANPGDTPVKFDVDQATAGHKYRRIRATAAQDPNANDGRDAEGTVTLTKDALFLARR